MKKNECNPLKIAIVGAGGRMGRLLTNAFVSDSRFEVVGLLEMPDFPHNGQAAQIDNDSLVYTSNAGEALHSADVIVDFSLPPGTLTALEYAINHKIPLVTGTTGFSDDELDTITDAGVVIPIVHASNMSIGITILSKLAESLAQMLPTTFEIELIEKHHRYKQDSPSGTALHLADLLTRNTKDSGGRNVFVGRAAGKSSRSVSDIFVHAIRGGGIVGEHEIHCMSDSEEIIIGHRALDRKIFVGGAIEAVQFVVDRAPGLYSMNDVLG